MDAVPSLLLDRLSALEAENAALRSRLQSCEESYALLQAEAIERQRQRQVATSSQMLASPISVSPIAISSTNDVLQRSLELLSTDPDLDNFVGHVLTAIAHQFQSPLTEYWSQNEHTAYVEQLYLDGRILDRTEIAQTLPYHAGLEGFRVPAEMINGVPLCQRKNPIFYEDHSSSPFTKDLPWVARALLPWGLLKEINVPLFLGDTTIGALTIHLPRDYQFTTEQVELAQALAHQVTLAAEMQRLAAESKQAAIACEREQAAQERAAEFAKANAVLHRNLSWLAREKDLVHFLEQTLLEMATTLKADLAHLFVVHPDRMIELAARVIDGQLSETGTPTEPTLFDAPFPADITPIFQIMEAEDMLLTLDLMTARPELVDLAWPDNYNWHLREGRKQVACLVLKAGDRSVGFLGFGFREYCEFSQETRELLMALANQAALAILLSQLAAMQTQAEQARADELARVNHSLQHSIDRLANDLNLESFLGTLLREAISIIDGLDAQIFLYDPKSHTLCPDLGIDADGVRLPPYGIIPDDYAFSRPIPADTTLAWSRMLARRGPIHFPADDPDQWPGAAEFHRSRRCNGAICAPMMRGDEPLGFIGLTAPDRESFTESELAFCHTITQKATLAIQMARLAEEARQTAVAREQEKAAQAQAAELASVNEALTKRDRLLSVVAQVTQELLENPNVEQAIQQALQKLGQAAGASRVSLLDEIEDSVTGRLQHRTLMEWTTPNTPRQIDDPVTHIVTNDDVAVIVAELHAGRAVCLSLGEYPEPIQAAMAAIQITVSGLAPIFIEGKYFGCLCFDNCANYDLWSEQEMDVLTTGAGAIGAALLRQRLVERLIQSQAEQQRAVELARANDALKRSLNTIATDADPHQIIAHILKIVAEQFESPLVEYWTHAADCSVAHLSLTYWQGGFLNPSDQPGHPGNTDFPCFPCLICHQNLDHPPYFLIEDITTHFHVHCASEQMGLDVGAWYAAHGVQQLLNIPLWLNEKTIGALDIWLPHDRHFTPAQIELAYTFGQQITLASYLNQLFEDAKQTVLFEERNRIASDIHDTLAQAFTGISLQLEVAKPLIVQEPETVEQILQHISQLAKNGLAEARRSVWALYPPGTEYANLAQMLYDSVEQMSRNTPISIEVNILGNSCPLSPYIGMNLLRIGQEALTNALKHSQAQTVLIELTYTPDLVSLSIRDDGRGFTPPTNLDNLHGGFGLVGMYERCDRIGALLSILSQPGQGTQILVESPLI
ncbi:MAG: GAF domain-containing protein [Leptolyngbyaceae bacterium]|nr:GAF domain-containing protein [Leptolyngbyaceae bacterium]